MPIKFWAEDDMPREKMLLKGKSALSDAELLAIIIGSGSKNENAVQLSQRILITVQNNLAELSLLSVSDLQKFNGIGQAKAIAISAAMELSKRRATYKKTETPVINSSKAIYSEMRTILEDLPTEAFWVMYLNNNLKLITKKQISTGGLTATVVDVRVILKHAVENLATSIALCHNHPSGNLKPSQQDIQITKSIEKAAQLLDIHLLDHIIITPHGYTSLKDNDMF